MLLGVSISQSHAHSVSSYDNKRADLNEIQPDVGITLPTQRPTLAGQSIHLIKANAGHKAVMFGR